MKLVLVLVLDTVLYLNGSSEMKLVFDCATLFVQVGKYYS